MVFRFHGDQPRWNQARSEPASASKCCVRGAGFAERHVTKSQVPVGCGVVPVESNGLLEQRARVGVRADPVQDQREIERHVVRLTQVKVVRPGGADRVADVVA